VTLYDAYMGIDPPFRLMEPLLPRLTSIGIRHGNDDFGDVVIQVNSGHGVDPYFEIPMPISVTTSSLNPTRVRGGQEGPQQAASLARCHLAIMVGWADGRAPPNNVF
jgi:hypothetical protein